MVSCRLVGTGALIFCSDRDARGFVIPEDNLDEALTPVLTGHNRKAPLFRAG